MVFLLSLDDNLRVKMLAIVLNSERNMYNNS
jgi:hypothetical protein